MLLSAVNLPAQNKEAAVENVLVDAVSLYNNGDFNGAASLLKGLAKTAPSNDAVHYYLGSCYLAGKEYQKAVEELKEASRLDPSNYWYRERLAYAYTASGQTEVTISIFEDLLKDYPKKMELYYSLANLYLQQNRLDDVIKVLDEIETQGGVNEETTRFRYELLMHQQQPDKAFEVLANYNEKYSSPTILTMMGDLKMNEYEDSIAFLYYDEALSYEPSFTPALLGKAEVFRIRRSYGEYFDILNGFISDPQVESQGKSSYLRAVTGRMDARFLQNFKPQLDSLMNRMETVHPADSSVLMTTGLYYFQQKDIFKADSSFKQICRLYPKDIGSEITYIQFLSYCGLSDLLKEETRKAWEKFPQEPGFLEANSSACYGLGDYATILSNCQTMISAFPKDSARVLSAYSSMGDIYHLLGETQKAYAAYDKALKVNPNYAPVLNNYAYYLSMEKKSLAKAYKMSKKTVEQEPDNSTYLDTFAWILYLQGKALEAKPFFKHAMLYGAKESAVCLDHYAEVLYALKEYDLAQVYWNMAKAKNSDGSVPDLEERVAKRLADIKK